MKIFLTRRAEKDYKAIKDYITQTWGIKTSETFTTKADEIFKLLGSFPEMGPIEIEDIRGFQLFFLYWFRVL